MYQFLRGGMFGGLLLDLVKKISSNTQHSWRRQRSGVDSAAAAAAVWQRQRGKDLQTLRPVEIGTFSTYLYAHMPKINTSKSCKVLAKFLQSSHNSVSKKALLEASQNYDYNFLSKYVTWGFYYSGVYTGFFPASIRHFQIAVPIRHYLRCYVHLVEIHPI
jgi:hypothetical protein